MGLGTALSGPLACCSLYNYTKWALWQTVDAEVGVRHCSMCVAVVAVGADVGWHMQVVL